MTELAWDDLLDDYEDRIDDLWHALEHGTEPNTDVFIAPEGSAPAPTKEQLVRLTSLTLDAQRAGEMLRKRMRTNLSERNDAHRAGPARRVYAQGARLVR